MLTIGKMSLACHVSIKTLHHYDRIGLLKPALIDPETGYRYYSVSQIGTMVLICRYKRFGFSLKEIAELLKADPITRKQKLERQKQILRSRISEYELALRDLEVVQERNEERKDTEIMQDYQIKAVEVLKQPVFGKRQTMSVGDFGEYFGQLFEEMAERNIRPAGCNGARYYDSDFDAENSDNEIFVPVGTAEEANGMIGGSLMAHTVHKGGYSDLNEGYSALVRWIEENGYEMASAPYELYTRNGFDRIPVSQWETEIFFPIVRRDDHGQ